MKKLLSTIAAISITVSVYWWGHSHGISGNSIPSLIGTATAQEGGGAVEPQSPVKPVAHRDVYYPGSEALGPDEMRITACGTGMPNARPKQAAACFLVELGNGDKFIFDIGTGSAERISALKIPYDYLDKVFIGHLHADHFGDLDALWIGGVLANRQRPLRVWGPSGSEKRLGTQHACDHMQEMFAWDYASRQGNVNTVGFQLEVNEFDYKGVNQTIYEENDVQIRSFPAIHALDGPVSFVLEWNGLKFVFGSDTFPNKWYREHAAGADLAIHECFIAPNDLVNLQKWPVADALNVGTQVHTSPAQFGKVMSEVKPRMAVAYHFFNDHNTLPSVMELVRKTYDGPVSFAVDYMVWNVTKDAIRTRMASIDEDIWPLPSISEKLPADPNDRVGFSEFINSGKVPYQEVVEKVYENTNQTFGTDIPAPK
ncbi:MAG: guanitoxin biosynthesis MBL fold metallo-hydrolase GntH [Verrucomicrobiales bacterium]